MGTAATFDAAREGVARAWPLYLAKRTADDFCAWRHHNAWTEAKYRAWDTGTPLRRGHCRGLISRMSA